jgi:citronellol/citronellal dehydrogenase
MSPDPLDGRVAFITGTSRGIGKALALRFAEAGADAVVSTGKTADAHDRLPGTIGETAEAIRDRGSESLAIQMDVRDESAVQSAVDRTVEEFGSVDLIVNNAGAIHFGSVADTPASRFDLLMGVNARGAYVTSRAALPHMREQGYGHVVMLSPPQTIDAAPNKAPYALSKLGMTFLAKSLAAELDDEPIGVNALWPVAAVETEATRHFEMGSPEDWRTPEVVCDATMELVGRDPRQCSGNAFYDEQLLDDAGIEDVSQYAVVEGSDPGPLSAQLFDPQYDRS